MSSPHDLTTTRITSLSRDYLKTDSTASPRCQMKSARALVLRWQPPPRAASCTPASSSSCAGGEGAAGSAKRISSVGPPSSSSYTGIASRMLTVCVLSREAPQKTSTS